MATKQERKALNNAKLHMLDEITASRAQADSEQDAAVVFNSGGPGAMVSVPNSLVGFTREVKLPSLGVKFSPLTKKDANIGQNYDSSGGGLQGSTALKAQHIRKVGTEFHRNLTLGERPTKSLLRVFHGHLGAVTSVDVLQIDGREFVFSGGVDRTCRMYDADTTRCLRIFEGHSEIVTSVVVTSMPGSYREVKASRQLDYENEVMWNDEETDILEFNFKAISKTVIFRVIYR